MLREEHMLGMFQNRAQKKIFEPKKEEMTEVQGILVMIHRASYELDRQ